MKDQFTTDVIQKKPRREKTPSELGDEVVARVLVEEGIMDPKDLEEYLASFEEPAAQTFTDAGGSNVMGRGANKLYSMQRNKRPISPVQIFGGNTGPIDPPPVWQPPADTPGVTAIAPDANTAWNVPPNESIYDMAQSFGYGNDPFYNTPNMSDLGPGASFAGGASDADSVFGTAQSAGGAASPTQTMPEWLALMPMQDPDYPGLAAAANQAGFGLKDKHEQLLEETHLAPSTSVEDYFRDKFKSGAWSGLENMRNGMVDLTLIGANADLEQQKQQAQQLAFLGGRYQHHADSVSDTVNSIREEMPEAAESFRSHEAAEHAQQIDEMYDAGGYYRLGGDIASKIGKTVPSIVMEILTGGASKMSYLYISTAGSAAAEARAGGADEETAQLYGMLSGSVNVAANKLGDIVKPKMKALNDWLMGMVQSNTGRMALKHLVKVLGNGAKDFIIKITGEYFSRMWNDDERSFWQTTGEAVPDLAYQEFIGTLANAMMNVSPNIAQ